MAKAMNRVDLNDFSGGISEQYNPEGFSDRQWSVLKGFIIDSDYSIRSQWPTQSVGSGFTTAKYVSGFTGSANSFLLAISTAGEVYYLVAPTDSANYTTTSALSWTKITSIPADTSYQFVCEVLFPIDSAVSGGTSTVEVNAMQINGTSTTHPPVLIYENDASPGTVLVVSYSNNRPVDHPNLINPMRGDSTTKTSDAYAVLTNENGVLVSDYTDTANYWTVANDSKYSVEVRYASASGTLHTTLSPYGSYTHSAKLGASDRIFLKTTTTGVAACRIGWELGDYPDAQGKVMPKANIGVMYRNRLILGDIETKRINEAAWSDANSQRSPSSFRYSEYLPDMFREQGIMYAGSGEAQILGMHVLDDALIIFTSPAIADDGVRMFRGTFDYLKMQAGTVTIAPTIIRGGVGPARDVGNATQRNATCLWAEGGIIAFLDRLGGVWYTNGVDVDRLDKTGPAIPDTTTVSDEVAAIGRYLFVKRGGRMLILNMLTGVMGESATTAWTEFIMPTNSTFGSMKAVAGSMYMVIDGVVSRVAVSRNNNADTERGAFNGTQYTLTVGTRTLADTDRHSKLEWFRVGYRTRGRSSNASVGTIKTLAGPVLDTNSKGYPEPLNRTLVARDEVVVLAGIGSATECSSWATFKGDVQLEGVTFWNNGKKNSRPAGGTDV